MDRRLDIDPERSRSSRSVSGDGSLVDCAVSGLASRLSELALSATDGERLGTRSFLTEKKVLEGREPGCGAEPADASAELAESISRALMRWDMPEPMFVRLARLAAAAASALRCCVMWCK